MRTRHAGGRTRVMIVEEDWDYGIRLADWLAAEGYQPVLVRSLDAVLTELGDVLPQALVVGIGSVSPHPSIAAVKTLLRLNARCPRIPVIAVVDLARDAVIPVLIRRTARRCVTKAADFAEIGNLLRAERRLAEAAPLRNGLPSVTADGAGHSRQPYEHVMEA
jgi:DNA-binding response OmpR family regulator